MDINDLVLTDKALEVIDNGQWIGAGDEAPDVEFLVTGMESEGARKLMKSEQARARVKARGKPLTDDQAAAITKKVLLDEVLKDWRGIESGGKELKYTKELAKKFMESRGGERFTMMVLNAARRLDENANSYVDGVVKN